MLQRVTLIVRHTVFNIENINIISKRISLSIFLSVSRVDKITSNNCAWSAGKFLSLERDTINTTHATSCHRALHSRAQQPTQVYMRTNASACPIRSLYRSFHFSRIKNTVRSRSPIIGQIVNSHFAIVVAIFRSQNLPNLSTLKTLI